MKLELISGELYQVKPNTGICPGKTWMFAIYKHEHEAYKTHGTDHRGKECVRKYPPSHLFEVYGWRTAHKQSSFGQEVKIGTERTNIRPATEESKTELKRLEAEYLSRQEESKHAYDEFLEFVG